MCQVHVTWSYHSGHGLNAKSLPQIPRLVCQQWVCQPLCLPAASHTHSLHMTFPSMSGIVRHLVHGWDGVCAQTKHMANTWPDHPDSCHPLQSNHLCICCRPAPSPDGFFDRASFVCALPMAVAEGSLYIKARKPKASNTQLAN